MVKPDWSNIVRSAIFWAVIGILLLLLAFWFGTRKGREWADSDYLRERDERMKVIAVHEENERRLAMENEKLRLENEAKAEILREIDSANEAKRAQDFQKSQDARKAKSEEIENASPGESVAGLCDDAKKAGLKLSFCE